MLHRNSIKSPRIVDQVVQNSLAQNPLTTPNQTDFLQGSTFVDQLRQRQSGLRNQPSGSERSTIPADFQQSFREQTRSAESRSTDHNSSHHKSVRPSVSTRESEVRSDNQQELTGSEKQSFPESQSTASNKRETTTSTTPTAKPETVSESSVSPVNNSGATEQTATQPEFQEETEYPEGLIESISRAVQQIEEFSEIVDETIDGEWQDSHEPVNLIQTLSAQSVVQQDSTLTDEELVEISAEEIQQIVNDQLEEHEVTITQPDLDSQSEENLIPADSEAEATLRSAAVIPLHSHHEEQTELPVSQIQTDVNGPSNGEKSENNLKSIPADVNASVSDHETVSSKPEQKLERNPLLSEQMRFTEFVANKAADQSSTHDMQAQTPETNHEHLPVQFGQQQPNNPAGHPPTVAEVVPNSPVRQVEQPAIAQNTHGPQASPSVRPSAISTPHHEFSNQTTEPAIQAAGPEKQTSTAKQELSRPVLDTTRPDLSQKLSKFISQASEQGKALKVRLHPPELGTLQIEVSRQQGQVFARIEVESNAVRGLIFEQIHLLRDQLSHQGLRIDQMNVEVNEQLRQESEQQHHESANRDDSSEQRNNGEQDADDAQDHQQSTEADRSRQLQGVTELDVRI